METVTLPPHSYVPSQAPMTPKCQKDKEESLVSQLQMDDLEKTSLAQYAASFAAIFVLVQILSTLYQIFILEQRVLDSGEKRACALMILFSSAKIIYTMVLIFYLFILSPENIKNVKIASFVIAGVQLALSIYLIVKEINNYKHPEDPETLSDLYALMLACSYSLELLVFAVMITCFIVILLNTKEPAQKRLVATQYVYVPVQARPDIEGMSTGLVSYVQTHV